jgi:predicted TIM-barrel fold metal-dependent hydrolase
MAIRRRGPDVEALNEDLPVDVLPASNGEFLPEAPSREQKLIMATASDEVEEVRRKFGLSRREFVRTAAAYGIGLWAINQVSDLTWGHYKVSAHNTDTNKACDLEWPGAQMNNLPGEFIFDIQSHHVEPDGLWRVTNPVIEAFFVAIWSQAGGVGGGNDDKWLGTDKDGNPILTRGGREVDPIENLSRYHYLKELYLDSSTNMCVLSAVPSDPNNQPLPIQDAARTVDMVNRLADSQRAIMHAFVMPNRGSLGTTSGSLDARPAFQQQEFDQMEYLANEYKGILGGWKTYPAWGDVPYASGWYFDDDLGFQFAEQVMNVAAKYGTPSLIATHKGFALPAFDQRAASPRDIGPAARQMQGVTYVVYHSGFDGGTEAAYPGDDNVNSADRSVNAFVKSLRENRWDASQFIPTGLKFGNVPNVYAEIGSTWRSCMGNPSSAAHLLGKLITHVGPKRICWGTDSLWFGSPQSEIVGLRNFEFSDQAKEFYGLPYGLEGDADDPTRNAQDASSYLSPHPHVADWPTDGRAHPERTIRNAIFGRNAARAYGVDADARRNAISCDRVQGLRDAYLINEATPTMSAPMASNHILGARTAEAVMKERAQGPWAP